MFLRFVTILLGRTKGTFVIEKVDENNKVLGYFVRPSVTVVEDDQMRFRNFTRYKVNVTAKFLEKSIDLAPAEDKDKRDHQKVKLGSGVKPNFYEYDVRVFVNGDTNPPVDAIGESRPGAIIDP